MSANVRVTTPLSALLLLGGAAGDRFGREPPPDRRYCNVRGCFGRLRSLQAGSGAEYRGVGAARLMANSPAILGAGLWGEGRGREIGVWPPRAPRWARSGSSFGGWLIDNGCSIFLINLPIAVGTVLLAIAYVCDARRDGSGAIGRSWWIAGNRCSPSRKVGPSHRFRSHWLDFRSHSADVRSIRCSFGERIFPNLRRCAEKMKRESGT
jgi:hypothetical protein